MIVNGFLKQEEIYSTYSWNINVSLVYNDKLKNVPKILETPYIGDFPPYKFEIEMIRKRKFNPDLIKDIVNFYK